MSKKIMIATLACALFLFSAKGFSVAEPFYGSLQKFHRQSKKKSQDPRIAISLRRMKPLLKRKEKRYIVVNIPEFQLYAIENGKIKIKMRVIVGGKNSPTPVLADDITHLVLNPRWYLPQKIASRKLLQLQQDPSYLGKSRIQVFQNRRGRWVVIDPRQVDWSKVSSENFPYRMVQQSGPTNAMGRIKFILSNYLQIYLHDTPTRQLFSKQKRDFSHGCIRVEKPLELASFLLGGRRADSLKKNLRSRKEKTFELSKPIPVFLVYWTAMMGEGGAEFYNDIYGKD